MKKILIAEDDQFLSNAYRVKLTKEGYDVELAKDGQEALDILTDYTPDLIILDLIMPVKDGFAVLEELKKNPAWSHIPVIITSNLGQKEDIDRGMQMGAKDYFVKSNISLNDIVMKITRLLG